MITSRRVTYKLGIIAHIKRGKYFLFYFAYVVSLVTCEFEKKYMLLFIVAISWLNTFGQNIFNVFKNVLFLKLKKK